MIPAVSLAQVQSNRVAFKGDEDSKASKPDFNDDHDSVEFTDDDAARQKDWEEVSERVKAKQKEWSESDSKLKRFGSTLLKHGEKFAIIAAAFFGGRIGFKNLVQRSEEFVKTPAVKSVVETVGKEAKKPLLRLAGDLAGRALKLLDNEKVAERINKFGKTEIGQLIEKKFFTKVKPAVEGAEGKAAEGEKTYAEKLKDTLSNVCGVCSSTVAAAAAYGPQKNEGQKDGAKNDQKGDE